MTINVPAGDPGSPVSNTNPGIHNPQHARSITQGFDDHGLPNGTVVMDIYTGTCVFDLTSDGSRDGLARDHLISLVPLGPAGTNVFIQSYPGKVTAIISASMTSFGDEPTGAAVDGATVKLKTITFPPPATFQVVPQ
jgi:hypothetical protein